MKTCIRHSGFIVFLCFLLGLQACSSKQKLSRESSGSSGEESNLPIRKKYATILGIGEAELTNIPLYVFIDKWTGTPYLYGGKNKEGIDCSGFTEMLYKQVYGKDLSGSSKDLFLTCKMVSKEKLQEGDLVFFKIDSDKISHVGVYLANGRFVHATVHKGVMISDLKEAYYEKYYYKGGRPGLKTN